MAQNVQSALRNTADVSHGASSSSANGVLARLQQLLPPLHSPKRNATVPFPPKHIETLNNSKQKSKHLKIRIVTWNMHDSLPKGNLGDLLGPVPAYVERKIENDEERFMLPDLSLDDGHPYHLVVVGGQECPTLSGIPMGLAANFKHKEPKNREFDKDRSNNLKGKEKERQSVARAETLLNHLKHEHFHHHHHRHHHDHNNMQPGDNTTITSGWSAVLEDWFSNGVGSLTGVKPVVTTGPVERPTPSTSMAGSLPVTEAPPDTYQPSVIGVNWETTDSRETEDHKGEVSTAIPLHKGPYRLLVKDRLMGIYIAVFVHRDIYPFIKDTVPTGLIGGRLGNKGGVGVSINLNGTRLLFINAHLAAHDGNTALRIANLTKIRAELTVEPFLPPNDSRLLKEDLTEKFDYTWIFGDLNFRLDITRLHADWLISKKEFNQALAFDQLNKLVKGNNPSFRGFREGKIDFPPTIPAQAADVVKEESSSSSDVDVDVDESLSSSSSETSLPDTQGKAIRHPTSALLSQIASKTKFALVNMGRRMKLKKEGYPTQNTITARSNGIPVSNSMVETEQYSDRPFPKSKSPRLTGYNSNCYDSSSKQRVPSWCDRILWRTTVLPESPKLEDDMVMRTKRFGRMLRPFRVYTADSYTFERRVQTVRPKPSSRSLFSKPKGRTTSLDLQMGLTTLLEERNVPEQGSIPGPIRSRSVSVDGEYRREELAEQIVCSISDSVPTPNKPTTLEIPSGPPPASTLSSTKRWLSQLWVKETRLRSDSLELKSSEKLPRRGELVCLSYHTLGDEQMARLEGKLLFMNTNRFEC
ncbi:hypothetical protein Clacol_002769 [Clathrus columnatus]|uniref:Inositol polyphosphate-related phosphatase domain-containing protein n=1 Tax=Clathrus columnatus TaxID=1419009 RepID=A0AAV5A1M1_9AGAM|nr:hypothetical protein Clacol_002769 [Clathrus columnatus]